MDFKTMREKLDRFEYTDIDQVINTFGHDWSFEDQIICRSFENFSFEKWPWRPIFGFLSLPFFRPLINPLKSEANNSLKQNLFLKIKFLIQ